MSAELQVVYRPVADLTPYEGNARTHSPEQIAQIAASIREFGWTNPILVDEHGGIIAGHGRLEAARSLGMGQVPTITIAGLTDAQRRALVLADNKLALNAGWDDDLLRTEIGGLRTDGFDLSIIGFSVDELSAILAPEIINPEADENSIPGLAGDPVTRPGDVWVLGAHRLMCGDSTNPDDMARLMDSQQADLLVSDPPYGIGYEYAEHDDCDNEENAQLVADAFSLHQCGKVWTPGLMNLARDLTRFGDTKLAIWNKKFAAAGNGLGGASVFEPILLLGPFKERRLRVDVLEVMTDREYVGDVSLRDLHSCPKPVELYRQLIEAFSLPGHIIVEPFSGSGTTLIACQATGRCARAMEITPAYVDVTVARWEQYTGKKAELLRGPVPDFAEL